ncbi:nucleoside 2-deoxyribosyltransferase [Synechococcus sp. UW105]|uniref:nucleoside 2-deoxyribosyltransferase n=1 Tax=Synechococcus sp. UW105 TaxID=337067 RepID=UPI000E0FC232|nr:nucleoside 2-deoxyribosyltransferase [Synechococcus sp. UW105]
MPVTAKTIYLASPLGFSVESRQLLLPRYVEALEALGLRVWEPFARNAGVNLDQPGWAYAVSQQCLQDVREADGLFAIVNGTPPDEGVMVELGVAFALAKPVFLFRDDFRRCTDSDHYPLNLMVYAGLPQQAWESYVHDSIDSIGAPDKALAQWALG